MNPILAAIISILLIVTGFYFPYYFGEHEAIQDAKNQEVIGSLNPNDYPFHLFNLFKRAGTSLFCIAVITMGLWYCAHFHRWFALFYLFYYPAAFGFNYTRKLNEARGLSSWYVSGSRKAKRFDRKLQELALLFRITPSVLNRTYHYYYLWIAGTALICWIVFEICFGDFIIKIR